MRLFSAHHHQLHVPQLDAFPLLEESNSSSDRKVAREMRFHTAANKLRVGLNHFWIFLIFYKLRKENRLRLVWFLEEGEQSPASQVLSAAGVPLEVQDDLIRRYSLGEYRIKWEKVYKHFG